MIRNLTLRDIILLTIILLCALIFLIRQCKIGQEALNDILPISYDIPNDYSQLLTKQAIDEITDNKTFNYKKNPCLSIITFSDNQKLLVHEIRFLEFSPLEVHSLKTEGIFDQPGSLYHSFPIDRNIEIEIRLRPIVINSNISLFTNNKRFNEITARKFIRYYYVMNDLALDYKSENLGRYFIVKSDLNKSWQFALCFRNHKLYLLALFNLNSKVNSGKSLSDFISE